MGSMIVFLRSSYLQFSLSKFLPDMHALTTTPAGLSHCTIESEYIDIYIYVYSYILSMTVH